MIELDDKLIVFKNFSYFLYLYIIQKGQKVNSCFVFFLNFFMFNDTKCVSFVKPHTAHHQN